MNVNEIYELADRYIAGQLSEAEREQADRRLEEDEAFADIFSDYVAAQAAMKKTALAEQKASLMARFEGTEPAKSKPRFLQMRWVKAVAAIFAVFLLGFLIWSSLPSPDVFSETTKGIYKERIFDKTTMATGAFNKLFLAKKYEEALALLKEQYVDLQPIDQHKNIERQGFCYWKLKDWDKALATFELLEKDMILKAENNPAQYYQALTYLAMDNKEKCKDLLRKMIGGTSVYKQKSTKLLETLGK